MLSREALVKEVAYKYYKDKHTLDIPNTTDLCPYIASFYHKYDGVSPEYKQLLEIAIGIYTDVKAQLPIARDDYLQEQQEKQRQEEYQKHLLAQQDFDRAKQNLEIRAREHTKKATKKQIFNLQLLLPFAEDLKEQLYDHYSKAFDEANHETAPPKKPKEKPFTEKVNEFVITHPDELLTPEEFANVSRDWNRNITQQKAYDYYQKKFFEIPGVSVKIEEPKNLSRLGFKEEAKYKFGTRSYELNPRIKKIITNSFPLKDNIKKYQLHKIAPRGTYIIDFMFDNKLVYLVCININTRYAMVELTNLVSDENEILKKDAKTTTSFLRALEKMIREVLRYSPIRHLTGDGEGAFTSKTSLAFYKQRGITFHPVPRMSVEGKKTTEPLHSSLSILDRFVRTLRDMLFQANYPLTPLAIKEMVRQYNNAPHSTLSKYIGFDVSPAMIQQDKNKEEFIVMKLYKENIATKLSVGFDLRLGTKVKVYNEKNILGKRRTICVEGTVIGKVGSLFKVKVGAKEVLVPRYKLAYFI